MSEKQNKIAIMKTGLARAQTKLNEGNSEMSK